MESILLCCCLAHSGSPRCPQPGPMHSQDQKHSIVCEGRRAVSSFYKVVVWRAVSLVSPDFKFFKGRRIRKFCLGPGALFAPRIHGLQTRLGCQSVQRERFAGHFVCPGCPYCLLAADRRPNIQLPSALPVVTPVGTSSRVAKNV